MRPTGSTKFMLLKRVLVIVCIAAVLAFTLSGCGGSSPAPFSKAVQAKLTSAVRKAMRDEALPGAIIGVWQTGKGAYVKTFGKANTSKGGAPNPADLSRPGSITKTFTGETVLELVDQGKLSLSDTVSKFNVAPGLANADQVTIAQLLNHSSGYPDPINQSQAVAKQIVGNPEKTWTPAEILAATEALPILSPPGTQYHYSNFNYYLLGMIIEKVTGKTAGAEIQALCASKLKLNNTKLDNTPAFLTSKPHLEGYAYTGDQPPYIVTTRWNVSWAWTAGSIVSNLQDLKTWIEADAKGTLLSPSTLKAQQNTLITMLEMPNSGYGLGIIRTQLASGQVLWWHNGAVPGYSSFAGNVPSLGITVVVLFNVEPTKTGDNTPATTTGSELIQALIGGK